MEIKQAEFIISAAAKKQFPTNDMPEIAFVGRSNAGKSSLINCLTNRRKLVKVSSTPGKTKLVNFFLINNDTYFVDLPGYGYAKISKAEKESWGQMIEMYLTNRMPLRKVVLLVDSRREPTEDDVIMLKWIKHYGNDYLIVATKCDKLKRNEFKKNEKIIKDTLGIGADEKIFFFSSLTREGKEELINEIFA